MFSRTLGKEASALQFCPDKGLFSDALVEFSACDGLMPQWLPKGKTQRVLLNSFFEIPIAGETLAEVTFKGKKYPAIVKAGKKLIFGFSPDSAIEHLLMERYCAKVRPIYTYLPFHYHKVPFRIQLSRLLSLTHRFRMAGNRFPAWPNDNSADFLKELTLNAAALVGIKKQAKPVWPNGKKFAVALSHDVDTKGGFSLMESFAEVEESFGMRATYNVLTNHYRLDENILDRLKGRGHELGWHGYNHDNMLPFLPEEKIEKRFEENSDFFARYNVRGMRSPCLLTSDALDRTAEKFMDYDSSIPDTGVFVSGSNDFTGCCSIFPYAKGELLEIPMTMPMDADLQYLGYTPDMILKAWKEKLGWIKKLGGVAVLNTHVDKHYSGNSTMIKTYCRFLESLSKESTAWLANTAEIAEHWKKRRP